MKFAVLEDEQIYRDCMKSNFDRYAHEHPQASYIVSYYEDGFKLLDDYRCDFDALFLDIQMPSINGMDVAHRIREQDEHVKIVFITNLVEYAVEGYSVQAFDYIIKPMNFDTFTSKIDRLLRVLSLEQMAVRINIKVDDMMRTLSSDEILYLEVRNHDVLVHTADGKTLKQWGALSKYEEKLQPVHFVRCNSCYLVNLKYVNGVQGNTVFVGEEGLLISAPKRKAFMTALAQYIGGSC